MAFGEFENLNDGNFLMSNCGCLGFCGLPKVKTMNGFWQNLQLMVDVWNVGVGQELVIFLQAIYHWVVIHFKMSINPLLIHRYTAFNTHMALILFKSTCIGSNLKVVGTGVYWVATS